LLLVLVCVVDGVPAHLHGLPLTPELCEGFLTFVLLLVEDGDEIVDGYAGVVRFLLLLEGEVDAFL
jgi:hypothetical protein